MKRQQRRTAAEAGKSSDRSPAILLEFGLRHLQSGQFSEAEQCCREILADDPDHAESLHLLGLISAETNRCDQAIEYFAQAIRKNPNNADYFSNLGTVLRRQDRFEEALKSFDLALSLKPDSAATWIKLGYVLQRQERFEEALLAYDHALKINPPQIETKNLSQADAFYKSGVCFRHLMRLEEACISFGKALAIYPDHFDALNDRGRTLLDMWRADEALTDFRKAIALDPNSVATLNNCGIALILLRRYEEALTILDRALSITPEMVEIFNNKGNALKDLGRLDEALANYDRAIALKPDYVEAHSNRGNCLDEMGRYREALSSYEDALALQPHHADSHWNSAVNRLRAGDLKTGWVEYEWRWKMRSFQVKHWHFKQPLWIGAEPIDGKVLLLHNEQGLGDALQFCRYVPLMAARGARVVLEIDGPLKELLSGLTGVSHCISKGETPPDFDFHCPLTSLPLAFDTTLDTIPSAVPYISVGAHATDWGARLDSHLPRIGLVWSGNPVHNNDRNRSVPLRSLLPLLDVEAQFVSLQKDIRSSDEVVLRERSDILHLGPELQSFVDTAALIEHLDLVISVDTSVAHLAGALARPVWIFLPYVPDWRWLLDREDSPWYPTARLFRQSQTREWHSVVDEMRRALTKFVTAVQPRRCGARS
ncbi:MAG: tetratricopeptide repeat protein [Bradyrhizobium sp.]|uniref:tetratricopeptide repeat protein n=1 Tax=Bradyrhizobium sp. TaxID=376 RepID=UPI00120E1791|nr:tetratricopeptide repeat protein [Bradyrhizobium sp.]THD53799.1 MAG: tetratricopeptide repeat protein [Bradyrhizobium sp.]